MLNNLALNGHELDLNAIEAFVHAAQERGHVRASELEELGLDSAADAILLVEWPERAGEGLWASALRLSLDFGQNDDRILTAEVPPSWEGQWPPQ